VVCAAVAGTIGSVVSASPALTVTPPAWVVVQSLSSVLEPFTPTQ
jgi:hypothetical protein